MSTQASAIWLGVAPWALAIRSRSEPLLRELPAGERKPGNEADAVLLAIIEHVLAAAIDEVVAVLHRRHLEHLGGGLDVGDRDVA